MTPKQPTIDILSTEEQIAAYEIQPVTTEYKSWNRNKVVLAKNTIIKTVCEFLFLRIMFKY